MWKFRRFRTSITPRKDVYPDYLKKFIVRQPVGKIERMHPDAKKVYNRMIQEPQPLKYKLQEISPEQKNYFWDIQNPLGGNEHVPFKIFRTHTNNLPVYSEYTHERTVKKTVIRHIIGDIDEFKRELSKIVSNAEIKHKTGKVIVSGMHAEKIKLWLRRLGF
jgi:large subunit ribosomal protein L49